MKKILLLLFLFVYTLSFGQKQDIQVGYQEFPTTITDQSGDSRGNIYYCGNFRGQLKIKDSIIQTGAGFSDIFIAKSDSNQNIIYSKTFSSPNDETASLINYADNRIYIAGGITGTVNFDSFAISPDSGNRAAGYIMQLDTISNVRWVIRTNLSVNKIFIDKNIIHVLCVAGSSVPVYFKDLILYPATSNSRTANRLIHLMLDTAGNLINYHSITPNAETDQIDAVNAVSTFSDGSLFMTLKITSAGRFNIGTKSFSLPALQGTRLVLIKLDTSYTKVSVKVLNSTSADYFSTTSDGVAVTLSKDSVYVILTSYSGTNETIDGLTLPVSTKNVLLVLDSGLTAKRAIILSNRTIVYSASSDKQVLLYKSINSNKNGFFITGTYVGSNDASLPRPAGQTLPVTVFPNLQSNIDISGFSKSFVIVCAPSFSYGLITWTGEHGQYESADLRQQTARTINQSFLVFSNSINDIWNPWSIGLSGSIKWGSMKKNSDRPDLVEAMQYMDDGSRIIIGFAGGKTNINLDSADVKTSRSRQDIFIARISLSGQVKWYKRFFSTLSQPKINKLVIRNNKIYFLVNYGYSINEKDFIKVNDINYDATFFGGSLFASIDSAGSVDVINLSNPSIKYAQIEDFNFFPDGDLAVVTNSINGNYVLNYSFPTTNGSFLIKISAANNQVVSARKFISPSAITPNHIEIDSSGTIYLISHLNYTTGIDNQFMQVQLHDGKSIIDTMTIENNVNTTGGLAILKMSYNKFNWYKRTTGNAQTYSAVSHGTEAFLDNHKLRIFMQFSSNGSMTWDKTLVDPNIEAGKIYVSTVDSSGNFQPIKSFPNIRLSSIRKNAQGGFFLNGDIIQATMFDTIPVGYGGGFTDAVSLIIDSTLKATLVYVVSSPYNESMGDMDIYNDSLVCLAYNAQIIPASLTNGSPPIPTKDYFPMGYLTTDTIPQPGYFRSKGSGIWNDKNVWESSTDNNTWRSSSKFPGNRANEVIIRKDNTITVTTDLLIHKTVVNSGGSLIVNPGATVTIK